MCGEHSPCSGRAASSFGGLSPGAARLFPPQRAARAARGLAPSPRARRAFSLRGPRACHRSGLKKSLDRNRGLFAGWEGVASLGLSLPLAPPPASYLQRGWGGSSLEFLSPFVLRTAGGVFRPVNFSLALPQFKKISCVPHPDPPSHLPLHPLPLGFPSAPGPSACLMHPTWAGDLFHPRYCTCFDAVLLKHPTLSSHRV